LPTLAPGNRHWDGLMAAHLGPLWSLLPLEIIHMILDEAHALDTHAPFEWFHTCRAAQELGEGWCRALYRRHGGLEPDMPDVTAWVYLHSRQLDWRRFCSILDRCEAAVVTLALPTDAQCASGLLDVARSVALTPREAERMQSLLQGHIVGRRTATFEHYMEYADKDTLRLALRHGVEAVAQSHTAVLAMEYKAKELVQLVFECTPHVVAVCVQLDAVERVVAKAAVRAAAAKWRVSKAVLQLLHKLLQLAELSAFRRLDERPHVCDLLMAVGDAELLQRPWYAFLGLGHFTFMQIHPRCILAPNVLDMFPVITEWPFGVCVPSTDVVARLCELYGVRVPLRLVRSDFRALELLLYAEDGLFAWPECVPPGPLKPYITPAVVAEMARRGSPLPWEVFWRRPKPWMLPFMGPPPEDAYAKCMGAVNGEQNRKRVRQAVDLVKAVARRRDDPDMVRCMDALWP
jgi:hypothetical protein